MIKESLYCSCYKDSGKDGDNCLVILMFWCFGGCVDGFAIWNLKLNSTEVFNQLSSKLN